MDGRAGAGAREGGQKTTDPAFRNRRTTDWVYLDNQDHPLLFDVVPKTLKNAHFAVMPTGLVEPCILAGTSAGGCCAKCRAPCVRGVWNAKSTPPGWSWGPSCACGVSERLPCVVLDPFAGTGTTGEVALRRGRSAILVEIQTAYKDLMDARIVFGKNNPLPVDATGSGRDAEGED